MSSGARGFTLLELLLVMTIAAIVAAVAMPRLVGPTAFDTRGFADQIAATVRIAQKLAIAQRREVFVRFTPNAATLCYDAGCAGLAPGPGGETPYTVSAPSGVAIASPVGTLGFDAAGRPDIAATLTVTVNGTGAHPVIVERETGYVH